MHLLCSVRLCIKGQEILIFNYFFKVHVPTCRKQLKSGQASIVTGSAFLAQDDRKRSYAFFVALKSSKQICFASLTAVN